MQVIEVTHGDGLAGSSIQYGFSLTNEMDLIEAARKAVSKAKIAALLLPGIGTRKELKEAVRARHSGGAHRHAMHRGGYFATAFRHGKRDGPGGGWLFDDVAHAPAGISGRAGPAHGKLWSRLCLRGGLSGSASARWRGVACARIERGAQDSGGISRS